MVHFFLMATLEDNNQGRFLRNLSGCIGIQAQRLWFLISFETENFIFKYGIF
jgi:hypothetical protein